MQFVLLSINNRNIIILILAQDVILKILISYKKSELSYI
jgi:hypothetical protein